ncbi:MAG: bacillithiol biosynthesis deacetylase BshB1 [Acidobacteriia bacterium]|nr:bacillithiol biosynthesis deacetylase BshB1 [Terriglobia bacterium]
MNFRLDLLAIGAHPDDVELMAGGTLLKMAQQGYKTGIVDLTSGERGTRGSAEIRLREAQAAAKILGLQVRENLGLPDAHLMLNEAGRLKIIQALRRLRPRLVMTHYWEDPHPDHRMASQLVTDACHLSGLAKLETGTPRFRPQKLIYFMLPQTRLTTPTFVVDITRQFQRRMKAVRAYKSQLYDAQSKELETRLSTPDFLDRVEVDLRLYGNLAQVKYAEAFVSREPLSMQDPVAFFRRVGPKRG